MILLMIPNEEKEGWYYLESCSKKAITLLRGIKLKHGGDFYFLNCLHFIRTENKLKSHEKVCKGKDLV